MIRFLGLGLVVTSILAGHLLGGGALSSLWRPHEMLLIAGSSIGAFLIANAGSVLPQCRTLMRDIFKRFHYHRDVYLDLLGLLYALFRQANTGGDKDLEDHIEHVETSSIFQLFKKASAHQTGMTFLCDTLRTAISSTEPKEVTAHVLGEIMTREIENRKEERRQIPQALQTTADSLPALGIVAAVLGVIHAMGFLSNPPEVIGHMIASALVGTFFGIVMAYTLMAPLAQSLTNYYEEEIRFLECIKAGIFWHLNGCRPMIATEAARKEISTLYRPSFHDMDEFCKRRTSSLTGTGS